MSEPRVIPPLDAAFRPTVLANREFLRAVDDSGDALPLVLALERPGDSGELVSRFETRVFGEASSRAKENEAYLGRLLAFLLWQRGAHRIHVGGPASLGAHAASLYGPDGSRRFDREFFGERVYGRPMTVEACAVEDVPAQREPPVRLGRHGAGCRIGFDLGASDRKVAALIDGRVVFQEETVWNPAQASDPAYHEREIDEMLRAAAVHLPRVDAIGGSAAGIYLEDRPRVATLFQGVPTEGFERVSTLFDRLREAWGVPFRVINDGDVTALAGSMALERGGLLGIALGSSEAGGFVTSEGHLTGWLNELAFCPIDVAPDAPPDDWSGTRGCGSQYLSQRAVFRLATRAGLEVPVGVSDAECLASVQSRLAEGDERAVDIWRSMGTYLGYAVALYADFYPLECVLILGRCTSGAGGGILLEGAREVLDVEFAELAARLELFLPDEVTRRVGQAIAAAGLPE